MIPKKFSEIFETTQSLTIPSGEEQNVYYGEIPTGYVGFLGILQPMYVDGVRWSWYIDGEAIEEDVDLLNEENFAPPYVIRQRVEVNARNTLPTEVLVEVYGDGVYQQIPERVTPRTLVKPLMLEPLPVETTEGKNVKNILTDIKTEIQSQVPLGETSDKVLTIGDTVYLFDEQVNGKPLDYTSFSILNRGPNDVYVSVNKWEKPEAPIIPGESHNFDFSRRGAIQKIYLVCDSGNSAVVKIHALK